jgi:hypothetical protein
MAADIARLDEYAFGLSWVVAEAIQRTSHALLAGGRVWLVDPVDHPDAMERVAKLGEPAGVVQLVDRHNRDCAAIATRLGVPHLNVPDAVPGSPFEAIPVLRLTRWRETALWWAQRRVLVVAEAIGTTAAFTTGHGAVGMHPLLRALPPSALRGYEPDHLLCGHGPPVHGPAARDGIEWAYAHARRDLPRLPFALARLARGGPA